MATKLDTEALSTLIAAVEKYGVELEKNKITMVNAADLCDQAMGSDAISQKHIAALDSAIEELKKTSEIVEKVTKALKEDLRKAEDVLED